MIPSIILSICLYSLKFWYCCITDCVCFSNNSFGRLKKVILTASFLYFSFKHYMLLVNVNISGTANAVNVL